MSYTRNQLENWLKTIDVKADKVLDAGGGSNPVKGRTKSWDVKEYLILDNKLEKMKVEPDLEYDLSYPIKYPFEEKYRFDVVFCLEVTEHTWNIVQVLKNLNNFLKEGGILYVSFLFIYPHHSPEGHDYLRYTRWGVEKLLKETGFRIEKITPRISEGERGRMLWNWFKEEAMHCCKTYSGHNEIGYLVKAIKI